MYLASRKLLGILMLLVTVFAFTACSAVCEMKFSFNTSMPSNSNDEKTIYINDDMDKLELHADLKVDSGEVTIQVLDTSDEEIIWNGSYNEDSIFKIELLALKANSEYLLKIEAVQSKNVKLIITSDNKLVKDKEKPEKYKVER